MCPLVTYIICLPKIYLNLRIRKESEEGFYLFVLCEECTEINTIPMLPYGVPKDDYGRCVALLSPLVLVPLCVSLFFYYFFLRSFDFLNRLSTLCEL